MSTPDAAHVAPLTPALAADVCGMTFPAYRHLLSLAPSPRHPDDGDRRVVQPVGVVASIAGRPVGLALAELPLDADRSSELLSVYVSAEHREQGVGTQLIAAMEQQLAERHQSRVDAVYMTGRPGIATLERIFARRAWQPPAIRTCTMRFGVDEAARMPWFGRVRLSPPEFELFPWVDLRSGEREDLIRSHLARPWITAGLEFWRHDAHGFDPVSSLGLRYRGAIVGWTINHRLSAETTRISGAFVRDDLSRRGRLMALWTASIERMRDAGVRWICSITPVQLGPMIHFLRTRCAPWATFFGETRGSHKLLVHDRVSEGVGV